MKCDKCNSKFERVFFGEDYEDFCKCNSFVESNEDKNEH